MSEVAKRASRGVPDLLERLRSLPFTPELRTWIIQALSQKEEDRPSSVLQLRSLLDGKAPAPASATMQADTAEKPIPDRSEPVVRRLPQRPPIRVEKAESQTPADDSKGGKAKAIPAARYWTRWIDLNPAGAALLGLPICLALLEEDSGDTLECRRILARSQPFLSTAEATRLRATEVAAALNDRLRKP